MLDSTEMVIKNQKIPKEASLDLLNINTAKTKIAA